jgi:UDPglucose 6-dehydrogenase
MLPGVNWCDDTYETLEGASAIALLTEWNEFRVLDFKRARELMKAPVMVDLRNVYNPDDMEMAGFAYTCVGRPSRYRINNRELREKVLEA